MEQRARARRVRSWMTHVAALGAASLWAAAAVPASAGEPYKEQVSFTDTEDVCGYLMDLSGELWILLRDGTQRSDGEFFPYQERFRVNGVIHDDDSDDVVLLSASGVFKEVKPQLQEGTVYTFETVEAGQPFVLRDSEGRALVRDRGSIRTAYAFDTLGDGEPGGTFLSEEVVRVAGPHEGFDEDFDICGLLDEQFAAEPAP